MEKKIKYFVRFKYDFDHIQDARMDAAYLDDRLGCGNIIQIGYHIPQPQYKAWVPKWLIKWITI